MKKPFMTSALACLAMASAPACAQTTRLPTSLPAPDIQAAHITVGGWKPQPEQNTLSRADFLTEVADQNGCLFRIGYKIGEDPKHIRAESRNVRCGANGYAYGIGEIVLKRADGKVLYEFNKGAFNNGLAVRTGYALNNQLIEPHEMNLPVLGFGKFKQLHLLAGIDEDRKGYWIFRLEPRFKEWAWLDKQLSIILLTENTDIFRDEEKIRQTLQAATRYLEQHFNFKPKNSLAKTAYTSHWVTFIAAKDMEQGVLNKNTAHFIYQTQLFLDRPYGRQKEWEYNMQKATNYLFNNKN